MEHNDLALLCQNRIFEGIPAEKIAQILPCMTHSVQQYHSQESLYSKGERVQNVGVVLEGALLVCDADAEGKTVPVVNIGQNHLFGEAIAFSTHDTIPHHVLAEKKSRVLYIKPEFFMQLCSKDCPHKDAHSGVMKNMLCVLSERALALNKKIAYLSAPDLKTKIAMYIYDLYEANGSLHLKTPLNRDQMADFLAVARPSLSREFINLKKMGIIDFCRSNIEILDLEKLQCLAQSGCCNE